jgi:hypothetical protein
MQKIHSSHSEIKLNNMADDFKKQMRDEFIPAIEELIKKEEKHMAFLKNSLEKLAHSGHSVDIDEMIEKTEASIGHFKHRLKEYQEYIEKK